ncbi:MAG: GTPase ObgE, partial [Desulfobacterota bacterium]|nr:GTPase ObgE [Thermodesulfobacteriota bacterium]
DLSTIDINNPGRDCQILLNELGSYNAQLLKKPRIIGLNKLDLISSSFPLKEIDSYFCNLKIPFVFFSALTGEGISSLVELVKNILQS